LADQPSQSSRPCSSNTATADLLLVNPAAGGGRAREILPDLERLAAAEGWVAQWELTQSAADFRQRATAAARSGRKRIIAVGGDGTFQLLVNAVAGFPQTVLGILPTGGGNDLAASLGLPPDPIAAAKRLLDGEVGLIDAVRVRTAEGNERLYTGGGGVGLDAEAARHANGSFRNLRGRWRYLLSAIRALAGFQAMRATISTGDGEAPIEIHKALLACVLNTPSYGAGLVLAPDAKTDDGKLDLVVLEDLTVWQILQLLPKLAIRGELKAARVTRRPVTCLRIDTDPPRCFHGDGEILGMTPVEISVVPRACRVLRARRTSSSSGRA
jgi:YegS/Rv2252/BmrU family lipid kinase